MLTRGVNAVRWAVAMVIAFFAHVFDWPARRLAHLAGWVAPEPMPIQLSAPVRKANDPATKYTVLRWYERRYWTLYEGPDGAEARRRYEAVERAQEGGRMEFQMTDRKAPGGYVVRSVYGELD